MITHNLNVVRHVADRMGVMYLGRLVEEGTTASIFASPRHRYTEALLAANPKAGSRCRRQRDTNQRRGSEPRRAAVRLRVPSALPLCARRVPDGLSGGLRRLPPLQLPQPGAGCGPRPFVGHGHAKRSGARPEDPGLNASAVLRRSRTSAAGSTAGTVRHRPRVSLRSARAWRRAAGRAVPAVPTSPRRSARARTRCRRSRALRTWLCLPDATARISSKISLALVLDRHAVEDVAAIDVHVLDHALVHRRVGGELDRRHRLAAIGRAAAGGEGTGCWRRPPPGRSPRPGRSRACP